MIVLRRFLRDRRRSLAWWSAGMVALVAMTVAFYPSIRGEESFEELMRDLPAAVRALVGAQSGVPFTSPPGYLHSRMFTVIVPVVLLVFGIGLGARVVAGPEDEGTLEPVLANPVSRRRLLVERALAVVVLVLGLTAVGALALVALGPPTGVLDGIGLGHVVQAWGAALSLTLLHAGVALAVGAAWGRRAPALGAAAALAVGGYLLEGLLSASDRTSSLLRASPWHWYLDRNALVEGTTIEATVVPLAVATLAVTLGAWRFERRDLR